MARLQAPNSLRTAVPGGLLHWCFSVVRGHLGAGRGFGYDLDADCRQCGRRRIADAAGVVPVLVEEARQGAEAASLVGSGSSPGRIAWVNPREKSFLFVSCYAPLTRHTVA